MFSSWLKAQLRYGVNPVPSQPNEKVPCPESPKLPLGMDESGQCRDRIADGDDDNTEVTFSDFFPTNPSLLLSYLKPILPAADNRVALASVITGNALVGLLFMTRRTPRITESLTFTRVYSILRKSTGSIMVACSLVESTRFLLPYDPWAEEAREWRHWAIRGGDNPSWWFGAIRWYEPMSMPYFTEIISKRLSNDRLATKRELQPAKGKVVQAFAAVPGSPLEELVHYNSPSFQDHEYMYKEFKEFNEKNQANLLKGTLKDVNELNKMARIDSYLEEKISHENEPEYADLELEQPETIHLPDALTRKDWEANDVLFSNAWIRCDPWWELFSAHQIEVRVVPSSKSLIVNEGRREDEL